MLLKATKRPLKATENHRKPFWRAPPHITNPGCRAPYSLLSDGSASQPVPGSESLALGRLCPVSCPVTCLAVASLKPFSKPVQ